MYQFRVLEKVVDIYDLGSIENTNTIWCFFMEHSEGVTTSQSKPFTKYRPKLFTIIFKTNINK